MSHTQIDRGVTDVGRDQTAQIIALPARDPEPDMRTIAETIYVDAALPEQYTVELMRDGIVLTCSVQPHVPAETFFIPNALRDWVARHAAVSPVALLERVL